jgi:hypothetical protein
MAGYSKTPLAGKLGIKSGHRVLLHEEPSGFRGLLDPLPDDLTIADDLTAAGPFNVIVSFSKSRYDLQSRFKKLHRLLDSAGGLWIAWPKKASGVATDLTEDVVRGIGLDAGLVDNKVCAIDETWSGLRLVIRLSDRPAKRSK